jgi:UDP-2-acetamido-3-amino-2,3-dideoxy-glucuronate N-acetyltransferase
MSAATFIHPTALVETKQVGAGTRIWAYAHVLSGARLGRNCNVCDHVFIEGGARVGNNVTLKNGVALWLGVTLADDVFVGPYAVFTNDLLPRSPRGPWATARYEGGQASWLTKTVVRQGASVGANATIVCGVTIGRFAMIGAGAVVTRDVPAFALVLGCPARVCGHVCACGERLAFEADEAHCGRCHRAYSRRGQQVRFATVKRR